MKILSIGDIHGSTAWKSMGDIGNLLNSKGAIPEFDMYIFLGDYTDHWDIPNTQIFENLKEIVEFKKIYPNNVVLLLGNHDLQYWFSYDRHGCTGFKSVMYFDLNEFFRMNRNLFQIAYSFKRGKEIYLWTHAGIHKGWWEYSFKGGRIDDISSQLNQAFEKYDNSLFDVGYSRGGSANVGGPFWADKSETWNKPLENVHQIIGHTRVDSITKKEINRYTSITYIDCLENSNPEPHILEI